MPNTTVTARFYVSEINYNQPHEPDSAKVALRPAYNNGQGNEAWSKATPSGDISLQISNPSAVAFFDAVRRANQNLHIEFSVAP
jgi:hypothetical protein